MEDLSDPFERTMRTILNNIFKKERKKKRISLSLNHDI